MSELAYSQNQRPTYKTYLFFLLVTKKANLLRMPLSACDEWLVPIQGLFTVTW